MGDFNAVSNPQTNRPYKKNRELSWKPEIEIFNFLNDWAFTDIQEAWEKDSITHTWSNKNTSSRIDYIWLSTDIASKNIHSFSNIKAESITNSDHTLLNIKLFNKDFFNIQKTPKTKTKQNRITIIDSKKAAKEQWKEFQEKVDTDLNKTNIDELIAKYQQLERNLNGETQHNGKKRSTEEDKLEEIWSIFQNCLIRSAKTVLPLKKIKDNGKSSKDDIKISPEHKKYRQSFKLLNSLNKVEKSKNQEELDKLIENIEVFNKNNPALKIQKNDNTTIENIQWGEWKKDIREVTLALREECYRIENLAKTKAINEAIIQRCQDFQDNQRKMINSLTNTQKKSIKIDRIMVTTEQEKFIETRPQEISKQVEDYYIKAFGRRKANFNRLDKGWKEQYESRDYIEQEWYKDLAKKPSIQELNDTIKDLPPNKAAGPSQITYEMLKNLSKKTKERLNEIFWCCIDSSLIPKSWKSSNIYPIPKNKEWEADLANTRPIMLMEMTRKCFTKIITNRLSIICKERSILRGPNFTGLPGESTLEPIQLINNICEEAREQNKELWILLQDTAKAFDTVNLEMLERALKRIKIPDKMTKLIIYLFKNREIKIITENGLTNKVKAGDGID